MGAAPPGEPTSGYTSRRTPNPSPQPTPGAPRIECQFSFEDSFRFDAAPPGVG